MPIIYCGPGDLLQSNCSMIVIPVNLQGVMGSGLALWYKQRYPNNFDRYRNACKNKTIKVGTLLEQRLSKDKSALLFPTKVLWSNPSDLEYIEAGLEKFATMAELRGCPSVAFPAIGCGLGGLSMDAVLPIMRHYLEPLITETEIYTCRR